MLINRESGAEDGVTSLITAESGAEYLPLNIPFRSCPEHQVQFVKVNNSVSFAVTNAGLS